MAPIGRRSTYNSKVTLYEPDKTVTRTSRSIKVEAVLPAASPARKRTRSRIESSGLEDIKLEEDEKKFGKVKKVKKEPSPKKPTPFKEKLDKAHPAPKRWEEAYEIIRKQRERIIAPVDTMGCEQGGRDREEKPPSDQENKLSILVSLMLSSQTKDPVTHQAVQNLRHQLPGGLTLDSLLKVSVEEIDACICKVGFHATKAANLQKLAIRLRDVHDGKVPEDLPNLLAINGVGPKMSILFLQAIGINAGIGVDVHVHRITNRLGWHKPATSTPEATRLNLESWLPKDLHPKINLMLVGFGQTICKPQTPMCDLCDVAGVEGLCPSRNLTAARRRTAAKLKKEGDGEGEGEGDEAKVEEGKPKLEVKVEREVTVDVKVKSEDEDGAAGYVVGEVEAAATPVTTVKAELLW
ncbi:DNA glycosylase [Meredithblackwellia eburnea MCA 4105]